MDFEEAMAKRDAQDRVQANATGDRTAKVARDVIAMQQEFESLRRDLFAYLTKRGVSPSRPRCLGRFAESGYVIYDWQGRDHITRKKLARCHMFLPDGRLLTVFNNDKKVGRLFEREPQGSPFRFSANESTHAADSFGHFEFVADAITGSGVKSQQGGEARWVPMDQAFVTWARALTEGQH